MYRLLFVPLLLFGFNPSEELAFLQKDECKTLTNAFCPESILSKSLLYQADILTKKHQTEVSKLPHPSKTPQVEKLLEKASIWLSIDLATLEDASFEVLACEPLWEILREIGVEGARFKNLKMGGEFRTGLGLEPTWGDGWNELACILERKGIALICDALGNATGLGADFLLALKNCGEYPGLYHLVEIEKRDWKLLPTISPTHFAANIPWLSVQELHKKGYVSEQFAPYVKTSAWNATAKVKCSDGKVRRWIYLKENELDPVINWLDSTFAGFKIASADVLESIYNLGASILETQEETQSLLPLWTRKLGGFSVLKTMGGLSAYKSSGCDQIIDELTKDALLHALLTQDAEALRLIYRLFLRDGFDTKRLVHELQPFDRFSCEWAELTASPKKRFPYYEEMMTGEALKQRLMKEDLERLKGKSKASWPKICMATLDDHQLNQKFDSVQQLHLLLAFFYAMQPGSFSFSISDLLGTLESEKVDLIWPNKNILYGSLPSQMKNQCSFAKRLRNILRVRKSSDIAKGTLVHIPDVNNRGLLILIHELSPSKIQLIALNFSKSNAKQTLEIPEIRQTSAIDLITGLAEKKPLNSPVIQLDLPPLSAKALLFQAKYYE